ncbi:MAG: Acetyltransferase (GNAT) family protein [Syntrophaceae bacterium PtaU1.Bin231]|nr:MAG: Acetyltransferase (GNAT) family protein [Syntrophaceae bacterium PtaU1.Bin231]
MYLRSIYVSPDRKGRGVGRTLMALADEHARRSGFREIWLGVMRPNRNAYEWYRRRGFSPREEETFTMGVTTVPCLICCKGLPARAFAVYDGFSETPLSDLCLGLFSDQTAHWRRLREAVRMLGLVVTKSFRERGLSLTVQRNPGRIASSTAAVGKAVAHRPCFLCRRHLPRSQKTILYREDFLILCNPAPIVMHHFTVASRRHRPQAFFASAKDYLLLCRDLGRRWDVLYNGPRCGASAPDHLHFQVIPSGILPLSAAAGAGPFVGRAEGVSVSIFRNFGYGAVVLTSGDLPSLLKVLDRLREALPPAGAEGEEPMFNALGRHDGKFWRLVVFPRRKHRPDIFHREEGERLLVTPGAFEMSGLVVVPRENDFFRIDKPRLLQILREVALPPRRTLGIAKRLLPDGEGR